MADSEKNKKAAGKAGGKGKSAGGNNQRRVLKEIAPSSWEHPADRAALNALRRIPGFDAAVRKLFAMFGERALRLAFKANAVRTSDNQYGWVHRRLTRVCQVLDVEKVPECYISQTHEVNAGAIGFGEPFIVLNSSLLEILTEDEMETVLGHEVGHIASGHVVYRTILFLLLQLMKGRAILAGIALLPITIGLLEWYRKSEISCDRAGLLSVQDPIQSQRALMKLAGGMRGGELDLDEFVAQAEEYRNNRELLDSVYKIFNMLFTTHPFAVIRVAELRDWIDSGAYDAILAGDYDRRGEQPERRYIDELREAGGGYAQGAREMMRDLDGAIDRLRSRFSEGKSRKS